MKIDKFYNKCVGELNEFFETGWTKNLPELIVMKNEEEADEIFKNKFGNKRKDWQIGWIWGLEKVYVLDKEHCKTIANDEDYFSLVKHELAHSFTTLYCTQRKFNCQKLPKWLWEGIAISLSGQTGQSGKLSRFLESYGSYAEGLYQEAGQAVDGLVKKFGKEKLLELVGGCAEIGDREDFERLFVKVYGIELNYESVNEVRGE